MAGEDDTTASRRMNHNNNNNNNTSLFAAQARRRVGNWMSKGSSALLERMNSTNTNGSGSFMTTGTDQKIIGGNYDDASTLVATTVNPKAHHVQDTTSTTITPGSTTTTTAGPAMTTTFESNSINENDNGNNGASTTTTFDETQEGRDSSIQDEHERSTTTVPVNQTTTSTTNQNDESQALNDKDETTITDLRSPARLLRKSASITMGEERDGVSIGSSGTTSPFSTRVNLSFDNPSSCSHRRQHSMPPQHSRPGGSIEKKPPLVPVSTTSRKVEEDDKNKSSNNGTKNDQSDTNGNGVSSLEVTNNAPAVSEESVIITTSKPTEDVKTKSLPSLYWRVHPRTIDDCLNCIYDGTSAQVTQKGQYVKIFDDVNAFFARDATTTNTIHQTNMSKNIISSNTNKHGTSSAKNKTTNKTNTEKDGESASALAQSPSFYYIPTFKTASQASLFVRRRLAATEQQQQQQQQQGQQSHSHDEEEVKEEDEPIANRVAPISTILHTSSNEQDINDVEYDWLLDGDIPLVEEEKDQEDDDHEYDDDDDDDTYSETASAVKKANQLEYVVSSLSLEMERGTPDRRRSSSLVAAVYHRRDGGYDNDDIVVDDDDDRPPPTSYVECSPRKSSSNPADIIARSLPRTLGLFSSHNVELAHRLPLPDIHHWRTDDEYVPNPVPGQLMTSPKRDKFAIEYYMSRALSKFTRTSQLHILTGGSNTNNVQQQADQYDIDVLNRLIHGISTSRSTTTEDDQQQATAVDVDVLEYYLSNLPKTKRAKKKKKKKRTKKKAKGTVKTKKKCDRVEFGLEDDLRNDLIGSDDDGDDDENGEEQEDETSLRSHNDQRKIKTKTRSELLTEMDDYLTESMAFLDTIQRNVTKQLKEEIFKRRQPLQEQVSLIYFMQDLVQSTLFVTQQNASEDLSKLKQELHLEEKLQFIQTTQQRDRYQQLEDVFIKGIEPVLEFRQVVQDAIRRLLWLTNSSSHTNNSAIPMLLPPVVPNDMMNKDVSPTGGFGGSFNLNADEDDDDDSSTDDNCDTIYSQIVPLAIQFQKAAFHPLTAHLKALDQVRHEAWTVLVDQQPHAHEGELTATFGDSSDTSAPVDLCTVMTQCLEKCLKQHISSISRPKANSHNAVAKPVLQQNAIAPDSDSKIEETKVEQEEGLDENKHHSNDNAEAIADADADADASIKKQGSAAEAQRPLGEHELREASREAREDVQQLVLETKRSFESKSPLRRKRRQTPNTTTMEGTDVVISFMPVSCRHERSYRALYKLRRQLEQHVASASSTASTTAAQTHSSLPPLQLKSSWCDLIVEYYEKYLLEECFTKVLPLVELGNMLHFKTAIRMMCRDITNVLKSFYIVETQWHHSSSTSHKNSKDNVENPSTSSSNTDDDNGYNDTDIGLILSRERSRLWKFAEALLVELLDEYTNVASQHSSSTDREGHEDLQGWKDLLLLGHWIDRLGQSFLDEEEASAAEASLTKEDNAGNSNGVNSKVVVLPTIKEKIQDILIKCVLQPCQEQSIQDIRRLLLVKDEQKILGNQEEPYDETDVVPLLLSNTNGSNDDLFGLLPCVTASANNTGNRQSLLNDAAPVTKPSTDDEWFSTLWWEGSSNSSSSSINPFDDDVLLGTDSSSCCSGSTTATNENGNNNKVNTTNDGEELSECRRLLLEKYCMVSDSNSPTTTITQARQCVLATNAIQYGLLKWIKTFLEIQHALPMLSCQITQWIVYLVDDYILHVFRHVCGNNPLMERVLLYNDISTSSFAAVTGSSISGTSTPGGTIHHPSGRSSPITVGGGGGTTTTNGGASTTATPNTPSNHHNYNNSIEAEIAFPPPNEVPRYAVVRRYLKQARERCTRMSSSTAAGATKKENPSTVNHVGAVAAAVTSLPPPSSSSTSRPHSRAGSLVISTATSSTSATAMTTESNHCTTKSATMSSGIDRFLHDVSATKSLLVVAVLLEDIVKYSTSQRSTGISTSSSSNNNIPSHADVEFLQDYNNTIQMVIPLMMSLLERLCCVRAIQGGRVVDDIVLRVGLKHHGWTDDAMTFMSQGSNDYVDELLERCAQIWIHIHHNSETKNEMTPSLSKDIWTNLVEASYLSLLEGFSRVPQCSTEGRALMSMDVAYFTEGISKHGFERFMPPSQQGDDDNGNKKIPFPPSGISHSLNRGMMWIDLYLKQYYFDQTSVKQWIEQHWTLYRLQHILSLIKSGATFGAEGRKRKIVQAELIEHSKLLYLHKQLNAATQ